MWTIIIIGIKIAIEWKWKNKFNSLKRLAIS